MKSRATSRFWDLYHALPENVQRHARKAFRTWTENPAHPGMRFRQVHPSRRIYSIRVGLRWRALGQRSDDTMIWFWIGSHAEYDRLVAKVRGRVHR